MVSVFEDRDEVKEIVRVDSPHDAGHEIQFAEALVLSKSEVFDVCSVLADLRQVLYGDGHLDQALWVEALFERLEDRISVR